jgi:NADH-quinone oxidoreductase subunit N
MAAFMFSLVGLPPFAGFVAKLQVMVALGNNGGWWWLLVGVIGLNTVFSLYYYARVIRIMYLKTSEKPEIHPNPLGMAISMLCAAMLVLMLIGFGPLNELTTNYGKVYLSGGKTAPATQTAMAHK